MYVNFVYPEDDAATAEAFDHLRLESGFWFLATPFYAFKGTPDDAFDEAVRIMRTLADRRVRTYSPVAQCAHIASYGEDSRHDVRMWLGHQVPFMAAAEGLLIATLPGWAEEMGVGWAEGEFLVAGKPVLLINPYTFEVEDER